MHDEIDPILVTTGFIAAFWLFAGMVQSMLEPVADYSPWGFYEQAGMVLAGITVAIGVYVYLFKRAHG